MNAKLPQRLFTGMHTKQIEGDHQYSFVEKGAFKVPKTLLCTLLCHMIFQENTGPRTLGKVLCKQYSFMISHNCF